MRAVVTVVLLAALVGLLAVVSGAWPLAAAQQAGAAAHYGSRVALVALGLTLWFWTQSLIGTRRLPAGGGMLDVLHEASAPLNLWLHNHSRAADALLVASSGFIDLIGLWLLGATVLGPSLRPFVALLLVYAFRQACQALVALPAPPGQIWRRPGFPSLLVTYHVGNDFFISGHTAIAVLGAIEAAHTLPPWASLPAALVAIGEAAVVIVLRAHYTMDVLGAAAAAGCAWLVAARWFGC